MSKRTMSEPQKLGFGWGYFTIISYLLVGLISFSVAAVTYLSHSYTLTTTIVLRLILGCYGPSLAYGLWRRRRWALYWVLTETGICGVGFFLFALLAVAIGFLHGFGTQSREGWIGAGLFAAIALLDTLFWIYFFKRRHLFSSTARKQTAPQ